MRVNEQNGDLGLLVCFATNASAIYFTKEQYVVFTVCDGGLLLLLFFLFFFFKYFLTTYIMIGHVIGIVRNMFSRYICIFMCFLYLSYVSQHLYCYE